MSGQDDQPQGNDWRKLPPPLPPSEEVSTSLDNSVQSYRPINQGSPSVSSLRRVFIWLPIAILVVVVPIGVGVYFVWSGFQKAAADFRHKEDERGQWGLVSKQPTMESLQQFLARFPDGAFKEQAVAELARLRGVAQAREDSEWSQAVGSNTPDAYTRYLSSWPAGRYHEEADRRLRALRESEDQAWQAVSRANSRDAYDGFILHFPNGIHVADSLRMRKISMAASARPLTTAEEAGLKPGDEFEECAECPTMTVVPSGQFLMGSPQADVYSGEADKNETPQHKVNIAKPFAIGKFQVTFEQWDDCVANGGCRGYRPGDEGWGRLNRPVLNISWDDAKLYVKWLSQKTGKTYRLLSETEWEYAARAGSTTRHFFGDDVLSICQYGNIADLSAVQKTPGGPGLSHWVRCNDGYPNTSPIGVFRPNAFGLFDMIGNVAVWVEDAWHDSYLGAPEDGSTWEGGDIKYRIARGGSWYHLPGGARTAYRMQAVPSGGNLVGMRVGRGLQ